MAQAVIAIAKRADAALSLVTKCAAAVSATAIFLMALLMGVNVLTRQVFHHPFLDTVLVGELAVVILTYMGLAWVYRLGRHVSVRVVIDRFPWKRRLSIEVFFLLLSLAALAVAINETWAFAYSSLQFGERLRGIFRIDAFPFHVLMPIGLTLLALEVLRSVILGIAAVATNQPELADIEQHPGQDVA